MAGADWVKWHSAYDRPDSYLSRRLLVVQTRVREALDELPDGPIQAVSMCSGEGRDILGVLAGHPRAGDVTGRLVEADPTLARRARTAADQAGLKGIEVVNGDASTTSAYVGAVPAHLVLACGIFGNVTDEDVARTVAHLPMLCAPGATVIWTRHRQPPDLTPAIRVWFRDSGFDELGFDGPDDHLFGVGANRLMVDPPPLEPGIRLFTFRADD